MINDPIRVLIVDDHAIIHKSITALLAKEPDIEVVGMGADGLEAIDLAQTIQPDVIVMDVSMPNMDGIHAAGKIRSLGIPSHIIMLSMNYDSVLIQQARDNGASGYIMKQHASADLIPAIRAAHQGRLHL